MSAFLDEVLPLIATVKSTAADTAENKAAVVALNEKLTANDAVDAEQTQAIEALVHALAEAPTPPPAA